MHLLVWTTATTLTCGVASAIIADRFLIDRIAILGSLAGFEPSRNPGIAFGLRIPPVFQEVLIGSALIIVAIVAVRHTLTAHSPRPTAISFGLILGGGIANIIDRIPDGLVTDFIQIGTFPTFNVADSCITIGAVLLIVESWRNRHAHP